MDLRELIRALENSRLSGDAQVEIKDIQSDSRQVTAGSLFVAVRGTAVDGHDYIGNAIEKGAVAIVCEEIPEELASKPVAFVEVGDSATALGKLISRWYGDPSDKLILVGVTGTNLLARMVEAGCEYAFMEVSSHAIDQRRISGLSFNGGIFTNLTRDHLDYHKTVDNYLKAKKKFFDDLSDSAFALTNLDDKSGLVMLQNTKAKKFTYSLRSLADFKAKILESHFEGTDLLINDKEVFVHFTGRFNAYNLLAVYGAAVALGKTQDEILIAMSTLYPVAGRFETIHSPLGYTAIVDYAHTPDALTNVLNSINEVLGGKGRVITVVGAGGNRDKGKRPLMAREAFKSSDQLILTSDNPRFEDPEQIIQDMTAGLTPEEMTQVLCVTDRAQAIKTATMLAQKGDVILIAGKGHEDYQEVKGVKHHFDDREQIRQIFSTQKRG